VKKTRSRAFRLAIDCLALVLIHFVLLQVLARTHLMEKMMAMQFNRWELAVILVFVLLRTAVYFLVPALLAALLAGEIFRRVEARAKR
jgi:hypothetical protein